MDADEKHRKLVTLIRSGKGSVTYAQRSNAMQPQSASGAMGSAAHRCADKKTGIHRRRS